MLLCINHLPLKQFGSFQNYSATLDWMEAANIKEAPKLQPFFSFLFSLLLLPTHTSLCRGTADMLRTQSFSAFIPQSRILIFQKPHWGEAPYSCCLIAKSQLLDVQNDIWKKARKVCLFLHLWNPLAFSFSFYFALCRFKLSKASSSIMALTREHPTLVL